MTSPDAHERLRSRVIKDADRLEKAKRERSTVLAQTVYLGTLGFMIALPVVAGAYFGSWLDGKLPGYSFSWTITFIFIGLVAGAVNVYFFVRE